MQQPNSSLVFGSEVEGLPMNKPRMIYFEKEDILHLVISDDSEIESIEFSPSITVELNAKKELFGVEILNASTFIRDSIMDSVQARMIRLTQEQPV